MELNATGADGLKLKDLNATVVNGLKGINLLHTKGIYKNIHVIHLINIFLIFKVDDSVLLHVIYLFFVNI